MLSFADFLFEFVTFILDYFTGLIVDILFPEEEEEE